jgi:hypothetical protein
MDSGVRLLGDLVVGEGRLDLSGCRLDGPNTIRLDPNGLLEIAGTDATVIRSDIEGTGDIHVALGSLLIIADEAVVDLADVGLITLDGSLVAQDQATIQNTTLLVTEAEFEGDNTIQNNDISLLEASTGYGGQFFVQDSATVQSNIIVSEGDRYLDLDPDPDSPNRPTITNKEITVIIKQGTTGSLGTLLELRALDYDAGEPNGVNPDGASGAYQVVSSPGFTTDPSENWVLEEIEVRQDAKLNLTNRQGFVYQDDPNFPYPETVYVKELQLFPNAVLNTALQALYYQTLVDENGTPLVRDPNDPSAPMTNGSRIVDLPLLGFSLAVIAMEDDTEFSVRVRKRLSDPSDYDPNYPDKPYSEGIVARDPNGGVMDMWAHDPNDPDRPVSSVAAKGAFARAGDEMITVAFDYLFLANPSGDAELIVYLSDSREVDANNVEVARVYPPASGRRGAVGSTEFATFHGLFDRGGLNFTRGVYVQIDLRGTDARCWIDNWDPTVNCQLDCGDYDRISGVSASDYLLLLTETGQPYDLWKDCLDLDGDKYVDMSDVLSWDMFHHGSLTQCGAVYGGGGEGDGMDGAVPFSKEVLASGGTGDVLLVAGEPNGPGQQEDFLYTLDPSGACTGPKQSPTCPEPNYCARGNGRLMLDSTGNVYQIHGVYGLIDRDTGLAVVAPRGDLVDPADPNTLVRVGITAVDEGLPLADAAFHPSDPSIVYVVPVQVVPAVGCPYRAAAKLQLLGGGTYDLVTLYGVNPAMDPEVTITGEGCELVLEPDVQRLREIETDAYGNLFVLSAQGINDNDWVLIYDEAGGSASEARVLISDTVEAPVAMTVSRFDDDRLYLASAMGDPGATDTQIYRFTIERSGPTSLTSADQVVISNMGYVSAIAENPVDGTAWVFGFVAPVFGESHVFGDGDAIFTTPTLAEISYGAGTADANDIVCHDLALPVSAVFVGTSTTYTLSLRVKNAEYGTVTFDPDQLDDPNDDPNDPCALRRYTAGTEVTLTAYPIEGRSFKRWRIFDPNYPGDANYAAVDTNTVLLLTMAYDQQIEATFSCASGVEYGLPLLGMVVILCCASFHRRWGRVRRTRSPDQAHS